MQLVLVGLALVFLLVGVAAAAVQTQDAINATVTERLNGHEFRLARLESALSWAIAALAANFLAHMVQIRSQTGRRERRGS